MLYFKIIYVKKIYTSHMSHVIYCVMDLMYFLCTDDTSCNGKLLFIITHACLSFSVGGLILDKTVTNPNFAGMAVFTPVINGE